jgi:hypothetical protein
MKMSELQTLATQNTVDEKMSELQTLATQNTADKEMSEPQTLATQNRPDTSATITRSFVEENPLPVGTVPNVLKSRLHTEIVITSTCDPDKIPPKIVRPPRNRSQKILSLSYLAEIMNAAFESEEENLTTLTNRKLVFNLDFQKTAETVETTRSSIATSLDLIKNNRAFGLYQEKVLSNRMVATQLPTLQKEKPFQYSEFAEEKLTGALKKFKLGKSPDFYTTPEFNVAFVVHIHRLLWMVLNSANKVRHHKKLQNLKHREAFECIEKDDML